jgi:ribosomal protein RSM22 (predicted rRNA methylase)
MMMDDDRGQGWKYYELQKSVGEMREKFVTQVIGTQEYKDARPGAPDDNDMMITQGDMLKQALQKGREAGTKKFFAANEEQITQLINKGIGEFTYTPPAPNVNKERMKQVEPPKSPSF